MHTNIQYSASVRYKSREVVRAIIQWKAPIIIGNIITIQFLKTAKKARCHVQNSYLVRFKTSSLTFCKPFALTARLAYTNWFKRHHTI